MNGYPLIYSRTKNADFVPDCLARPRDMDYRSALKYVDNVMGGLDFLQEIRHTIFPAGKYCVCGIACISEKLVEKVRNTSEHFAERYPDVDEYLKDCKGRVIACFIGIAIDRSEAMGRIPDISLKQYLEVYLTYLKKQWLANDTHSDLMDRADIPLQDKLGMASFLPQKEAFGKRSVVKDYEMHKESVLDYFISEIFSGKEVSFISGISDMNAWNALNFQTAAVSDSLYNALKTAPTGMINQKTGASESRLKQTTGSSGPQVRKTPESIPAHGQTADYGQKKTANLGWLIPILVILLIGILFWLKRR